MKVSHRVTRTTNSNMLFSQLLLLFSTLLMFSCADSETDLKQEVTTQAVLDLESGNLDGFNRAVVDYCSLCGMTVETSLCNGSLVNNRISVDEASCVAQESTPEEFQLLVDKGECLGAAFTNLQRCLASTNSCDDGPRASCIDPLERAVATCDQIGSEYVDRINVACYGAFRCGDGAVIEGGWVCDGEADCIDASDEAICG